MAFRARWHFLRPANRVSVEGRSKDVWFWQFVAPLLSAVGGEKRIRGALGGGVVGIRRPDWPRMEMAVNGRGDDEIAAGWGKKPGEIRPIAANKGRSAAL